MDKNGLALVVVALLSLISPAIESLQPVAAGGCRIHSGWHQPAGFQWVQNLAGMSVLPRLFLLPALSSALLWPVVLHVLRGLRRYYQVS
ncbi:MAG: hypothetical protein R3E50_08455 [Halioglobus sp.]